MGALTIKPYSLSHRKWETVCLEQPDFFDDSGTLVYYTQNGHIIRCTSTYFMRDRVRFAYDGFRSQRLMLPMFRGRTVAWMRVLCLWWRLVHKARINLVVDGCQPFVSWIIYLLRRLSYVDVTGLVYSIDVNVHCTVYHGGFLLEAAHTSEIAVPLAIPYDEFRGRPGSRHFSIAIVQILRPSLYHLSNQACLTLDREPTNRIAVFQVSPLQRMLYAY